MKNGICVRDKRRSNEITFILSNLSFSPAALAFPQNSHSNTSTWFKQWLIEQMWCIRTVCTAPIRVSCMLYVRHTFDVVFISLCTHACSKQIQFVERIVFSFADCSMQFSLTFTASTHRQQLKVTAISFANVLRNSMESKITQKSQPTICNNEYLQEFVGILAFLNFFPATHTHIAVVQQIQFEHSFPKLFTKNEIIFRERIHSIFPFYFTASANFALIAYKNLCSKQYMISFFTHSQQPQM